MSNHAVRNGIHFNKTIHYKNHRCAGCKLGILTSSDVPFYWQSVWNKNDLDPKQKVLRYHLECLPSESH